MPNYQEMYAALFQRVTAVINELQEVQQQTEEMYISSEPANIRLFDKERVEGEKHSIEIRKAVERS